MSGAALSLLDIRNLLLRDSITANAGASRGTKARNFKLELIERPPAPVVIETLARTVLASRRLQYENPTPSMVSL